MMGSNIRLVALATALAIGAPVSMAMAADATIWGKQTGLGEFETQKVDLAKPATITSVTVEGSMDGLCIWSGKPTASVVVCGEGSDDLVGVVLPAGQGYFLIPGKANLNSPVRASVDVDY